MASWKHCSGLLHTQLCSRDSKFDCLCNKFWTVKFAEEFYKKGRGIFKENKAHM